LSGPQSKGTVFEKSALGDETTTLSCSSWLKLQWCRKLQNFQYMKFCTMHMLIINSMQSTPIKVHNTLYTYQLKVTCIYILRLFVFQWNWNASYIINPWNLNEVKKLQILTTLKKIFFIPNRFLHQLIVSSTFSKDFVFSTKK